MNAASQATTVELAGKIAHIGMLFRAEFRGASVDLNPWLLDDGTQSQLNPHSIDLSFYFDGCHAGLNCSCVLVEVEFSGKLLESRCKLTSVEVHGFKCGKKVWDFSTTQGEFVGLLPPCSEVQGRFRGLLAQILRLFKYPNYVENFSE